MKDGREQKAQGGVIEGRETTNNGAKRTTEVAAIGGRVTTV